MTIKLVKRKTSDGEDLCFGAIRQQRHIRDKMFCSETLPFLSSGLDLSESPAW